MTSAAPTANHFFYGNVLSSHGLDFIVKLCENDNNPLPSYCDWNRPSGMLHVYLPLVKQAGERAVKLLAEPQENGMALSETTLSARDGTPLRALTLTVDARPADGFYSASALSAWLDDNKDFIRWVQGVHARLYGTQAPQAQAKPLLDGMECVEGSVTGNKGVLESTHAHLYRVDGLASLSIPLGSTGVDQELVAQALKRLAGEDVINLRSGKSHVVQVQIPEADYGLLKDFALSLGLKIVPE